MSHKAFREGGDSFATQASVQVPGEDEPTLKMHRSDLRKPFSPEDLNGDITMIELGDPIGISFPAEGKLPAHRKQYHVMFSPAKTVDGLNDAAKILKSDLIEREGRYNMPRLEGSIEPNIQKDVTTFFAAEISYTDRENIMHVYYVLPNPQAAKLMRQKLQQGGDFTRVVRVPNR